MQHMDVALVIAKGGGVQQHFFAFSGHKWDLIPLGYNIWNNLLCSGAGFAVCSSEEGLE